jgi:hypothetical protein
MPASNIFMNTSRSTLTTATDDLVDEVFACYVEWLDEVAVVEEAFRRWSTAASNDRRDAFGAYTAAVDQEQAAAETYIVFAEALRTLQRAG